MTVAVLVIDVQEGLCVGPGAAFDCAGTIARINLVTAKARAGGAAVVFVQHEETVESGNLLIDSDAWQLATGLETAATDIRLRKTTPDAFLRTRLDDLLRERGVDEIVVCGMHSEFCVDTTVRRALALGYPVRLVADAHTSAGNAAVSAPQVIAHHNATLANIASFGPRASLVTSEQLAFGDDAFRACDEVMASVRGRLRSGSKLSRDGMNER